MLNFLSKSKSAVHSPFSDRQEWKAVVAFHQEGITSNMSIEGKAPGVDTNAPLCSLGLAPPPVKSVSAAVVFPELPLPVKLKKGFAEGGLKQLIPLPRSYLAILKILKFRRCFSFLTRPAGLSSAPQLGIKWAVNKLLTG